MPEQIVRPIIGRLTVDSPAALIAGQPISNITRTRPDMKKALFAFVFSMVSAAPAFAYDFSECQVVEIVLAGENNAHVQLDCVVSNAPACAVANRYLGFDKTTTGGKQYLAMLTLAHAMGGKVEGGVDHAVCSPFQGNVALLIGLRTKLPQ